MNSTNTLNILLDNATFASDWSWTAAIGIIVFIIAITIFWKLGKPIRWYR